jgi:hypothetical protein
MGKVVMHVPDEWLIKKGYSFPTLKEWFNTHTHENTKESVDESISEWLNEKTSWEIGMQNEYWKEWRHDCDFKGIKNG